MNKKKMLAPEVWDRLQPFIHHKRARQRIIFYLVAAGYTVPDMRNMTAGDLRALSLHTELTVARDELLEGVRDASKAFFVKNKPLPHTAFYRYIRLAAESALGRPMSQQQLHQYLNTGKLSN